VVALATSVESALRGSPGWLALVNPIQATAMFGAMVFLLASRPRGRELALFTASAPLFALGHRWWLGLFHFVGVPLGQSLLFAAGASSLLALGARAVASRDPEGDAWDWFHLAAVLPCFGMAMGLALDLTIPLHPRVFDPVVMALDGAFGQPSFLVGRVAEHHPALLTLLSLVYLFLPVVMAVIFALEQRRVPGGGRGVLRPILLAAAAGYALYQIYPVVGPEPLLGLRFPGGSNLSLGPDRFVLVAGLPEPRNCMPSLHVGWALLLYWQGRMLGGAARAGTALWLALTALATLATGQHYFVDLVVAVPFAALVAVLAEGPTPVLAARARTWLIVATSVSLAAWYATLRLAPPVTPSAPPLIAFAAVTVAASWALHARWSVAASAAREDSGTL
jgi:hypothetical protein